MKAVNGQWIFHTASWLADTRPAGQQLAFPKFQQLPSHSLASLDLFSTQSTELRWHNFTSAEAATTSISSIILTLLNLSMIRKHQSVNHNNLCMMGGKTAPYWFPPTITLLLFFYFPHTKINSSFLSHTCQPVERRMIGFKRKTPRVCLPCQMCSCLPVGSRGMTLKKILKTEILKSTFSCILRHKILFTHFIYQLFHVYLLVHDS